MVLSLAHYVFSSNQLSKRLEMNGRILDFSEHTSRDAVYRVLGEDVLF